MEEEEESEEFQLLEAYCLRRGLSRGRIVFQGLGASRPLLHSPGPSQSSFRSPGPSQSRALPIQVKIQQDKVLQQELRAAFSSYSNSYSLFEKIICGRPTPSTKGGRRQQIAWAFEVTSRLSAVDLIPKRRALSVGTHFLRQHHSAWVQEHGGWVSWGYTMSIVQTHRPGI
ncbi:hypothetical protein CRUP_030368 [Coryphaenoides rupestris]|nr:hypothetical protein CRUP_030368 [Coryphaenoides rupestris]